MFEHLVGSCQLFINVKRVEKNSMPIANSMWKGLVKRNTPLWHLITILSEFCKTPNIEMGNPLVVESQNTPKLPLHNGISPLVNAEVS